MTTLAVKQIRTDGGTQSRAEINTEIVEEYAELMKDGLRFPPVTVFYDGTDYWLADGFHRLAAAKIGDSLTIHADITQGSRRDAILYSAGANADHGLRRTNADKHRSVILLLEDEEWNGWSDSEIGKRCKVHHSTVAKYRRESSLAKTASDIPSNRAYTTKHGTTATMNTKNIGKKKDPVSSLVESVKLDSQGLPKKDIPHYTADDFEREEDNWEDAIPYSEEEPAKQEPETKPDYAIRDIKNYIEMVIDEIPDLSGKHQAVNETIRYLRDLSTRYHRLSIAEGY